MLVLLSVSVLIVAGAVVVARENKKSREKAAELERMRLLEKAKLNQHIQAIGVQVCKAGYEDLLEEMAVHEHEDALEELSDEARLFFFDTGLIITSPGEKPGDTQTSMTELGRALADYLLEERETAQALVALEERYGWPQD